MLDMILTMIFVFSFMVAMVSPLISGPYGGGFKFARNMSDEAKFGWSIFLGLIGGILALHLVCRFGVL